MWSKARAREHVHDVARAHAMKTRNRCEKPHKRFEASALPLIEFDFSRHKGVHHRRGVGVFE